MITVRLMERLWASKDYSRIVRELLGQRAEAALELEAALAAPADQPAAAALLLIRLDELSQSHVPLYSKLVQTLVNQQQIDGGWGSPIITALCLRALFCGSGSGFAIERGVDYLASLQKEDGSWPIEPLRRMPADPYTSAFVLSQLADRPEFRDAVRYARAARWLENDCEHFDSATRRLLHLARSRGRSTAMTAAEISLSTSGRTNGSHAVAHLLWS